MSPEEEEEGRKVRGSIEHTSLTEGGTSVTPFRLLGTRPTLLCLSSLKYLHTPSVAN